MQCSVSVDIAIVGGGLSGLALAHQLGKDESWLLLEAHATHYGGRIRNTPGADIDLGPAWLWPGQNEIASLLTDLSIETFTQPDDPSSLRIVGGSFRLIQSLVASLPKDRLKLDWAVTTCTLKSAECPIVLENAKGERISAKRVVLAAPPLSSSRGSPSLRH